MNYYNEFDPAAAQWLRNLIDAGHIAPGHVDERSIEDVHPSELRSYSQCHFFAGIGVWSYALRQSGWPDDRQIWTGSCPCQPFSSAGKGAGFADERHLWPAFYHLIEQCRPRVVFGEQVASKDGLAWVDLVLSDLEAQGYAAGAVDTCAAGFGAPHIRQRLYWVGNANSARLERHARNDRSTGWQRQERPASETGLSSGLVNSKQSLLGSQAESSDHGQSQGDGPADLVGGRGGVSGGMADAHNDGHSAGITGSPREAQAVSVINWPGEPGSWEPGRTGGSVCERPSPVNGFWRDADWLGCRDGKWRPVKPGLEPLVNGSTGGVGRVCADQDLPRKDQDSRVIRLKGYGNAINAEAARVFIESVMEVTHE